MARRNTNTTNRTGDEPTPTPTPTPPANPNVFSDDYALASDDDDLMPIADGFRPTGPNRRSPSDRDRHSHDRSSSSAHRPSTSTDEITDATPGRVNSQSSVAKPPYALDRSTPDPADSHHSRSTSTQAAEALRRHASITSTTSFVTSSDTPFNTGPSHPYAMYPQNPVGRSSSVTTSSTQRATHYHLPSLTGPTHPYGMYPQNVVEDDPLPPVQSTIPLGFPGLNTGYHRRLGPDGEEQDIIGPDGHTEQLPPYTRYPEEGPTKAALVAEASATPIVAPVPAPGSAPLQSLEDAAGANPASPVSPVTPLSPAQALPPQRQEAESANAPLQSSDAQVTVTSAPSLTATDSNVSEKQDPKHRVTPWRKKRLWGRVPISVAIGVLLVLLIFATILGAAIGTFVAKTREKHTRYESKEKDHDEPSPQVTGPNNTLFDASPIPTPTSLSSIPTGSFALPLGIAQESSKNCLKVVNQLSAWSCKMTFAPLVLTVNNTGGRTGQSALPMASIAPLPSPDKSIQYGIQPFKIARTPLQLVLDLDFKVYGPAYHFSALYDKLVVLGQGEFAAGAAVGTQQRRDDKDKFRHRFQVMPGDTPWFCYWNQTYLEGYIYVEDNSTAATFTNFPTAWPSGPFSSSLPLQTAPATATAKGPSVGPSPAQPTRPPTVRKDEVPYPRYTPYPRIVKIEERRLPGSPQPYCQQMRLLDDLNLVPAVDGAGTPIRIFLTEEDPSFQEFLQPGSSSATATATTASGLSRRSDLVNLERREDPPDACHCQWMFQ